ncbi:MAG: helix-turn-helix domain-containing protein [Oscillospiraceae bacterium]|nr:helix-turn-helix domain-containing protein [Oscillospiraceae bacterium]
MGHEGYDKQVFARNLTRQMVRRGERQTDVARLLGVSKSAVSGYCKGTQIPRMDKVEKLAQHYGILKAELLENLTGEQSKQLRELCPMPSTYRVPRLGRIACGAPILAQENLEGYDEVPEHIPADFTLVCRGDSMITARIFDGDLVYIHQQESVENGDIAAVLIDEEATLKRFYHYTDRVELRAENPTFPVLNFEGEQLNRLRILGKAVAFVSMIR